MLYTFVHVTDRDPPPLQSERSPRLTVASGVLLLEHFEYPLRSRLFPELDSTDDYILICWYCSISTSSFLRYSCLAILALIEFKQSR